MITFFHNPSRHERDALLCPFHHPEVLQLPIKVHDGIREQNDGFKGVIKLFLVTGSPQIYTSCDLREAAEGIPGSPALALQII